MHPSSVKTLSVPAIGAPNPALLGQAGTNPMRLAVRNTGGTPIVIAHDVASLSNLSQLSDVYQLPVGGTEVFVLAPRQQIFAACNGGGGFISIAVSEAYPVKMWMES
jgi:hypothetical protein